MSVNTSTEVYLARALCSTDLAKDLIAQVNNAVAGAGVVSLGGVSGVITASAGRTALGLGTAATHASGDFQASNAALAAIVAGGAPVSITGSKASGAALASLIAAFVALGLGTDNTSA